MKLNTEDRVTVVSRMTVKIAVDIKKEIHYNDITWWTEGLPRMGLNKFQVEGC